MLELVTKACQSLAEEFNDFWLLAAFTERSFEEGIRSRVALTKAWAKAHDPLRRAKIAAARQGKPRPAYVVEGMRLRKLGTRLSVETRRKMSEAHKRRGTRPPAAGRAWEQWEDDLLGALPAAEVATRTGRTIGAVRCRRSALGLTDERTRPERRKVGRSN